ncbi:hypothetical protein AX774_g2192 [Zancudomyces culisetae]|uniref:Uncharacterized protein n=1 Tax=Zancudomyces culisetae TaxID=1213189 RepID=A0A1R1PTR7_ZANCU|nr:hypothetical protein AX774_g2192 [Zancudomyces culisetae]|eukprot:OMH84282.1 hypothetical protein AX774_g2192 [Zancudomyces culisetae]
MSGQQDDTLYQKCNSASIYSGPPGKKIKLDASSSPIPVGYSEDEGDYIDRTQLEYNESDDIKGTDYEELTPDHKTSYEYKNINQKLGLVHHLNRFSKGTRLKTRDTESILKAGMPSEHKTDENSTSPSTTPYTLCSYSNINHALKVVHLNNLKYKKKE